MTIRSWHRIQATPDLLKLPLVRNGNQVTIGLAKDVWKAWLQPVTARGLKPSAHSVGLRRRPIEVVIERHAGFHPDIRRRKGQDADPGPEN